MSDDKKKIKYVEWESVPLEEFFKRLPKPTLRMRISRLIHKIKGIIFPFSKTTTRKYKGNVGSSNITHNQSNANESFRKSQHFDPEKAYIERKQEDAYLNSAGFTREDLILTEEEYIKRKQEDAYFESAGFDDER